VFNVGWKKMKKGQIGQYIQHPFSFVGSHFVSTSDIGRSWRWGTDAYVVLQNRKAVHLQCQAEMLMRHVCNIWEISEISWCPEKLYKSTNWFMSVHGSTSSGIESGKKWPAKLEVAKNGLVLLKRGLNASVVSLTIRKQRFPLGSTHEPIYSSKSSGQHLFAWSKSSGCQEKLWTYFFTKLNGCLIGIAGYDSYIFFKVWLLIWYLIVFCSRFQVWWYKNHV
jgi:hypothetical protein